MPPPTIEELMTVHLRYGTGAAVALRTRAFAQIASKVLYLQDTEAWTDSSRVANDVATVVGIQSISRAVLGDALALLRASGVAEDRNNQWRLTLSGRDQIVVDLNRTSDRVSTILGNHFPGTIDRAQLNRWFRACCAEYFARFGNRWVATICRGAPPGPAVPGALENLTSRIATRTGLAAHKQELQIGFRQFLASSERTTQEQIWSMCQAMFAARLVAAEVGADPILTADIRDSFVLLDTNILFVGALESNRFSAALAALGNALSAIGLRLYFLHLTKEEYQHAVGFRRENTLRVVERFRETVVESAVDDFIRTATGRGCTSRGDFERFFDELHDPIRALGGELPISELDDAELDQIATQGTTDETLKRAIAEVWNANRTYPKRGRRLEHDAAVTTVAETLVHRGQKCWVLTLDRTMQELSLQRAGKQGLPIWISLDSLLQILSVDSAGPQVQAENFAPLLASILEYEVEPAVDTYAVEDLSWLIDIEERCADLNEDRVKLLATTISRARLAGKPKTDPELHLAVQRAFQTERVATAREAAETRREAEEIKRAYAEEKEERIKLQKAYLFVKVPAIRRGALTRFIIAVVIHLLVVVAIVISGFSLAERVVQSGSIGQSIARFIVLLAPSIGAMYRIVDIYWPLYRRRVNQSEGAALEQLMRD